MSTTDQKRRTRPGRPAKDRVRQFTKHVLNPVMLLLAGRVPGGFVVPLPYATEVDWLRNVLAAGTATLRSGGRTYVCRFGIARYLRVTVDQEKGK